MGAGFCAEMEKLLKQAQGPHCSQLDMSTGLTNIPGVTFRDAHFAFQHMTAFSAGWGHGGGVKPLPQKAWIEHWELDTSPGECDNDKPGRDDDQMFEIIDANFR